MPDILHDLKVCAPPAAVFDAVSSPAGLDSWWTLWSQGRPATGQTYVLGFSPEFEWQARVTACEPARRFELTLTDADPDWLGTRVVFELENDAGDTRLRFGHLGWQAANAHFRQSSFCWAMYLNVMRRLLESGVATPYDERDSA